MGVLDRSAKINLVGASALICEPNEAEQDILAAILNSFGVAKITRSVRPDMLADEARRNFDMIFVGVSALNPEAMAGISTLRKTVDHPSRTSPIVIISGYPSKTLVQDARTVGATFVIAKPLTTQIVFERILWLASTQREFIECDTYFGPDRRVRKYGPPLGEPGRRIDDLSPFLSDALDSNMTQDAIDDLMKPARLVL